MYLQLSIKSVDLSIKTTMLVWRPVGYHASLNQEGISQDWPAVRRRLLWLRVRNEIFGRCPVTCDRSLTVDYSRAVRINPRGMRVLWTWTVPPPCHKIFFSRFYWVRSNSNLMPKDELCFTQKQNKEQTYVISSKISNITDQLSL